MHKNIKRIAIVTVGTIFVLLGLAGLVLPFLQGLLFLVIGFILLSLSSPSVREWMEQHTRKRPKLHAIVERVEAWIVRIIGRP
jgi:uncharacterized membrane protein YbaN (DUF454 family)